MVKNQFSNQYYGVTFFTLLLSYVCLTPFYYLNPEKSPWLLCSTIKYLPYTAILFAHKKMICIFHNNQVDNEFPEIGKFYLQCVVIYSVFCMLSLVGSPDAFKGFAKICYYLPTGFMLAFLVQMLDGGEIKRLIYNIIALGTTISFIGIVVWLFKLEYIWHFTDFVFHPYYGGPYKLVSTLGNATYASSILIMIFPLSAAAISDSNRWQYKSLMCLSSILIFIAILLTNSRMGIIIVALSTVVLYFFMVRSISRRALVLTILATVLSILCLYLLFFYSDYLNQIYMGTYYKFQRLVEFSRYQTHRLYMIEQSVTLLQQCGIGCVMMGLGFGQLTGLLPQAESNTVDVGYVSILAEIGVLGLFVFGLIFLGVIRPLLTSLFLTSTPGQFITFRLGVLLAIVNFLLMMLSHDIYNQPSARILVGILLGLGIGLYKRT